MIENVGFWEFFFNAIRPGGDLFALAAILAIALATAAFAMAIEYGRPAEAPAKSMVAVTFASFIVAVFAALGLVRSPVTWIDSTTTASNEDLIEWAPLLESETGKSLLLAELEAEGITSRDQISAQGAKDIARRANRALCELATAQRAHEVASKLNLEDSSQGHPPARGAHSEAVQLSLLQDLTDQLAEPGSESPRPSS